LLPTTAEKLQNFFGVFLQFQIGVDTKMTQQQLADLVHVSSRTIISIEKEQYSPSLMLAYRIATVFGVSVEELCCLEENMKLEDTVYENL
jgi:putative transcriptional regulator